MDLSAFLNRAIDSLRKSRIAMMVRKPWRRIFRKLEDHGIGPDHTLWFVKGAGGVIHVGANSGQEAWVYGLFGVPVYWFEPIPEVFARLEQNIQRYRNQKAIQALVTDVDDTEFDFNVAVNDGASSSIFQLDGHKTMFPGVDYCETLKLRSISLDTAVRKYRISNKVDCLVLDTQGAELLVLKGALRTLPQLKWIMVECADFEAYKDCCTCSEITEFLRNHGFREEKRARKASVENLGSYYDVLFCRRSLICVETV